MEKSLSIKMKLLMFSQGCEDVYIPQRWDDDFSSEHIHPMQLTLIGTSDEVDPMQISHRLWTSRCQIIPHHLFHANIIQHYHPHANIIQHHHSIIQLVSTLGPRICQKCLQELSVTSLACRCSLQKSAGFRVDIGVAARAE